MGFWDRSLPICKSLCDYGHQSVRPRAQQTGLSKSRVHRLRQAMAQRDVHPESWWWETAVGRQWLTRRMVATLSIFGLKRGVGVVTMRAFCVRLRLPHQLGCSPTAVRGVLQALEKTSMGTAQRWEQEGATPGAGREILGAVDATVLEQRRLVCMALPSGSLLGAEVAPERTYTPGTAVVDERLKPVGAPVLSLVSARAKALRPLAAMGFACLRLPDCLHCLHASGQSDALALGQQLRPAQRALTHAAARLARRQDTQESVLLVEAQRAAGTRWTAVPST